MHFTLSPMCAICFGSRP